MVTWWTDRTCQKWESDCASCSKWGAIGYAFTTPKMHLVQTFSPKSKILILWIAIKLSSYTFQRSWFLLEFCGGDKIPRCNGEMFRSVALLRNGFSALDSGLSWSYFHCASSSISNLIIGSPRKDYEFAARKAWVSQKVWSDRLDMGFYYMKLKPAASSSPNSWFYGRTHQATVSSC